MANSKTTKECKTCKVSFVSWTCQNKKFCSHKCYSLSLIGFSSGVKGKHWKLENSKGYKFSKGNLPWNTGVKMTVEQKNNLKKSAHRGSDSCHWISDRTLIKSKEDRNNSEYKQWRYQVYKRDRHICKMKNKDCNGSIEAHHILSWSEYPELRYVINNGITLCKFHHPRKKMEVIRLSPYFQEIISNKLSK